MPLIKMKEVNKIQYPLMGKRKIKKESTFVKEYKVDEKEQAKQNESSLSHQKSNKTQIIVDIDQNTHRKSISYFNIDSLQKEEKQDSSFT